MTHSTKDGGVVVQLIRTAKENAFHVDSLLEPRLFDNGPVLSSLIA